MSNRYTDKFGKNVEMILCEDSRIISGRMPREVRNELMAAVIGRLKKDGLKNVPSWVRPALEPLLSLRAIVI
jgi:hypothetical protein